MEQDKIVKKHLVMKYSDIENYCTEEEKHQLRNILIHIAQGRTKDEKKPTNHYLVVNEDKAILGIPMIGQRLTRGHFFNIRYIRTTVILR